MTTTHGRSGAQAPTRSGLSTRERAHADAVRIREDLLEAWRFPHVRQGFLAMLLIALGAFSPAFVAADAPLYTLPVFSRMLSEPARFAATAIVLVGLLRLLDAWLRLRPSAGVPTAPVAACAWWSLPVLVVPPLFSRDAYSYAAQGLVVSRGMDPYQTGPIAVPGPFADQVDPLWLFTPAPYGPVALQVQRVIVDLTGGDALLAAIAMRVPALVGVAVIAYALPRLAERMGVSRDQAVWLGVLNPLVLMHLVGGMHNDALMIALVVAGLLLASDGRWATAAAVVALGAGFKQTAVLALVGVAGLAYRHARGERGEAPLLSPVDQRAYVHLAVKVGLVALAAFTALTIVTGLGWGWIGNLGVPGSVLSVLSPVSMAGAAVAGTLTVLGMPEAWTGGIVPFVQGVGLVGVVAALAWITWVLGPRRPVAAAAWALVVFTAGSPTVYAWYVLWGVVLFGATYTDRRVLVALMWATGWLVAYSMLDVAVVNGASMIGIAAVAWGAWTMWRRRDGFDTPLPGVEPGPATADGPTPRGGVSAFLVRA